MQMLLGELGGSMKTIMEAGKQQFLVESLRTTIHKAHFQAEYRPDLCLCSQCLCWKQHIVSPSRVCGFPLSKTTPSLQQTMIHLLNHNGTGQINLERVFPESSRSPVFCPRIHQLTLFHLQYLLSFIAQEYFVSDIKYYNFCFN